MQGATKMRKGYFVSGNEDFIYHSMAARMDKEYLG